MADVKKLARLHRVRTLQLNLVRADEARAHDRAASESLLTARITALADAVAPATQVASAASLSATAHFRERLHDSATAARARVDAAEQFVARASEATRAARRDQSAIEKLIERAEAEAVLKAIRALEAMPPSRPNRHDPC
ncbi:MAG TPA: hypothetical protein VM900_03505 [Sphingomonas sp.]|jgi:hypothetical protein|nr:hypothetical protein [Sphingomonas sp.]